MCRHKEKYLTCLIPDWSYICLKCERINVDGKWKKSEDTILFLVDYIQTFAKIVEEQDKIIENKNENQTH